MILEPSTQLNLYAHDILLNKLIDLFNRNKLPNKILLSGQKGIGKSTLTYHLINYVLSLNEEYSYDLKNYKINNLNKSFKLIQNNTNPNFYLVDVAKDKNRIDVSQIRDLILDLNKSSFNLKPRFVLLDNIELLNVNSINALLKILEEPNENINFFLINSDKKILPTLKSRCLNFKVFMSYEETIEVISKVLGENIYDLVNKELLYDYITAGQLIKLIKFSKAHKFDLKNLNLKDLLSEIIKNKIYKKEQTATEIAYSLIQLYFRNNISVKNIDIMGLYIYFLKMINNTKIFNLDEETLFMEFEEKVLNE